MLRKLVKYAFGADLFCRRRATQPNFGGQEEKNLGTQTTSLRRDKHREPYSLRRETPEFQILIRMREPEMMAAIRAKAARDRTSIAEAIRVLITWGLEAEGDGW